MMLRGFGAATVMPMPVLDFSVAPPPMPLPPQPPPEGYGQVSCLEHPGVENCYWEQGTGGPWGFIGPALPPETVVPIQTGAPSPSSPSIFGDLGSLPPALMIGGLIFFLLVASAGVKGKTIRSLVS